jgi:Secretion system C-terminal sorting domain
MKYPLCFLVALSLIQSSYAQTVRETIRPHLRHQQMINRMLLQQRNKAAMKTTAGIPSERVIAQSTRDNTLATLNDSLNLKYGVNKGSTYDYNTMIYPYNYPYATSPLFNYAGTFIKPQVLFDTLRRWTVNPNTLVYGYYEMDLATYDAGFNTTAYTELFADSSFYTNKIYVNTFTTANKINNAYTYNWHTGIADSAFKQFFTYSGTNKVTKDSTYEMHLGVWRLASKSIYTYDVSDNLTQIDNFANETDTSFLLPLVEQIKYVNTYDVSNRLLTVLASYNYGGILTQYIKDTFAYTGAYAFHTAWREHQWDPINSYWAPMFNMTKILNGLGLPDTVYIQSFDSLLNSWVPQTMEKMHYNVSNDPDTLKDYEYNWTSFPATPNFTTVYYYQPYLITTGTQNVPAVANNIKVYPNPATNIITIAELNVPQGSGIIVELLNVSGQVVSRQGMPWRGEAQVSVKELQPGMYFMSIQDAEGNMLHRQAIIKN